MLRNLSAEMARHGIAERDIAAEIEKSIRSVHDKINGKFSFSMPDAIRIRDRFFPGMTLEYLFKQDGRKTEADHDTART